MPSGHAVLDGSNLATEGRSDPSLKQLDEAIAGFTKDHDFSHLTVVVDASFEHRVAKKDRASVRRRIDDGSIIAPPAGTVGRGDAFILEIADRAGAVVVSNDSFQEFHGQFEWLFDKGRLIGGKPVKHVGWVFVPRLPVRGPTSREAVRKAKTDDDELEKTTAKKATKKTPAKRAAKKTPAKRAAKKSARKKDTAPDSPVEAEPPATEKAAKRPDPYNPVRAWQRFRRDHPVGSTAEATVERFSSHGAYARTAEGLAAYVPTSLLAHPAPSRARDILAIGEPLTFVVHEYDEERRGIDLGLLPAPAKGDRIEKSAQQSTKKKTTQKKAKPTRRSAKKTAGFSSKRSSSRR